MKSSAKADTKTHIIDIAERHFATEGFGGTTLRGIIKEAKVNVAAVAYHFGTKEELYAAVVERFAAPVVSAQLQELNVAMDSPGVTAEDVVRSFYGPPLRLIKSMGNKGETLSLFLGRSQTEPEPVYSMVDKNFAACRDQYIAAFKKLDPSITESEGQWRFEFMLSLIVCFLTRQKPIRQRYSDTEDWKIDDVLERLTLFCTHGLSK
ncbi:MAG: TetR/AcrR family transcriptional regulator [Candidatus Obscuribacterales bacterium]|nr:TetR/AcrR family transcriptional regulator [Candidatus Obscuribacterales bacterium]